MVRPVKKISLSVMAHAFFSAVAPKTLRPRSTKPPKNHRSESLCIEYGKIKAFLGKKNNVLPKNCPLAILQPHLATVEEGTGQHSKTNQNQHRKRGKKMETSTTIKKMLANNQIVVPAYQRAYSWDTEPGKENSPKQVNTFLSDLADYIQSATTYPYYFGHFLFEEKSDDKYAVIDGQQRLTTIAIFLSALFRRLKRIRPLSETEQVAFEDLIKRKSTYRLETVDYDNLFFKDYVIDQTRIAKTGLATESEKRIAAAFDFFVAQFENKEEAYLLKMLDAVQNASCTTHPIKNESEAVQMFIFQNNRGKRPSHLESIKAQFMFYIHLHGGQEKEALIKEIKERFEKIYQSISSIEYRMREDDVLVYTQRVYFNSLLEGKAVEKINKLLSEPQPKPILFIKSFTLSLAETFAHLKTFLREDEREHFDVWSCPEFVDI